ncbi:MAG: Hpt domain-containing protein, partial [Rudaea sp.]
MKLQDGIDFTTLNWVKQELDETLKQSRQALEAYVEDPADSSLMRFCATYLHQVQGTLRMVELYGAAMVVEEMERVALALLDGNVKPQDETYAVLMRGIVQLPDYLERLQSGHKDIPIVLLPLLNDLRATRGEKLLTESVLFSPDLSAPLPVSSTPSGAMQEMELKSEAARLRTAFQLSLLRWIREDQPAMQLDRLISVLDRLRTVCSEENCQRLWWIATGVLESIASGALETNVSLKLLFGKVDREIKRLVDGGEASFRAAPPVELVKNLLYYIAHSAAPGARSVEIRETYKLDTLLPSEKELEHAKGSISGHNRTLLDTVSLAIKDDLMRVKEALDIFLRSQNGDPADLMPQADVLDRVGDTLGMLGLGVPRRVVLDQRKIVEEISNKTRPADESALLDVAGALLYVEASLDDHIERLGADTSTEDESRPGQELELPKAEVRKILEALMKEASVNIVQAKQDIVAFIESPWDHARVEPIPRLLEEIAGALRMLNLAEPAQLMNGIVRFVEVELLRHRRVPTVEQMDKLADALASIEYYMEATREQRGGREKILDVTRQSLTALGYWPVPQDDGGGGPSAPTTPDGRPPSMSREPSRTDAGSTSAVAPSFTPPVFAAAPTVATADAQDGEFPRWSTDMPASGEHGLKIDTDQTHAEAYDMPSIDLPDESLDAYLARVGQSDDASARTTHDEPLHIDQETISEIHPPHVEIAPGHGLEDLIVGEARTPEPDAHDLSGLKLVETETTATPAPSVRYVEVEEEIEEEVPDVEASSPIADASFSATPSDDIDEEIREVFVEEVQDEIDNLNRALPAWRSDSNDFEKLKPIRRSFHTLKGSGRLVGALALGEFSWKVENMLNRVLDKTIPASACVLDLIDNAVGVLPELLVALRGEGMPTSDIAGIMEVADQIAAGEEVWVRSGAPRRTKKVKRIVRKLVPVVDELPEISDTSSTPTAAFKESTAPFDGASDLDIDHAFAMSVDEKLGRADINVFDENEIIAGPLPNIDPVLFDILKSEVASHLETIDGYLADLKATPGLPATEPLLRAVHTLNGAIAMVDIPVISQVLAPLEGYVKRLRARQQSPDAAGVSVLAETSALVAGVIAQLESDNPQLPESGALAAHIAQLRDTLPEPEMMHTLFSLAEDEAKTPAADAASGADALIDFDTASLTDLPSVESASLADVPSLESPAEAETVSGMEVTSIDVSSDDDLTAAFIRELDEKERIEKASADAAAAEQVRRIEDAMALKAQEQAAAEAARAAEKQVLPEETELLSFEDLAQPETELPSSAADRIEEREAVQPTADVPTSEEIEETIVAFDSMPEVEALARIDEKIALAESVEPVALSKQEETAFSRNLSNFPPLADDLQPEGKLELPDLDEDLLEIFVQEGEDILDHSDSLMAKLRESPQDRDLVTGMQRDLHTLKGGARMAGLAPIGDLSHAMESLLESISENRRVMDRITIDSLERGYDRLHGLVQRIAHRQAIAMPEHAIARFEGLVSGDLPASMPAVAELAPIDVAPIETSSIVSAAPTEPAIEATSPEPGKQIAKPTSLKPARQIVIEEEDPQARVPQEMIRVRSDLLDSLVNYAGEVSIYRSRLEQQISTFRFNLIEFEQTVSRLREQLRKLELETEAQILSRYQREQHESDAAFDPLELDRFSQLQQLSRALAESVSDLVSIQGLLDDLTRQSETLLLQQSRVSSDLQEGLMRTRMVPFDSLVPSLRRTLRQAAQEVGKRAQLKVEGAQGEMDRNLLERMKAPFEHMLRNALAHGIESPEDRAAANKPAEGTVTIQVSREATEVVLKVSDDGKGMDRDAIRRKAIERGLLKPDAQLSDRDLYGFILETGFSTAEQVTQLAGRGVGMDVVHNEIKQLGGSLAIDSVHGTGTMFTVRLPFTLAVTQAILVRLGESTYAVPMSSVQGVVRIAREDLARRMTMPNPTYAYAGDEFLIYELSQLLNLPPARISDETQLPLLMTRTGDQRAAVRIDGVIGSREIVVKSVGPQISSVPGIFGATIM